jgi:hypothetical protein
MDDFWSLRRQTLPPQAFRRGFSRQPLLPPDTTIKSPLDTTRIYV